MPGIAASAAVVVFEFDPAGTVLGFTVRWQYAAVAAIIFAALLCAGAIATVAERRRRARLAADPERPAALAEAARAAEETVRASAAAGAAADEEPAASPAGANGAPDAGGSEAASSGAPATDPVDPVYTGWTPGHTVPHASAAESASSTGSVSASLEVPGMPAPPEPTLAPDAPPNGAAPGPEAAAVASMTPTAPRIPLAIEVLVPPVAAPAPVEPTAAVVAAAPAESPAPSEPPDPAAPADTAPVVSSAPSDPVASSAPPDDERPWPVGLRLDDLLFIVAAATAGAVVVGRLGWVLLYLDWYRVHTESILDSAVGGLTLAGGVAGGVLAGLLMALVLGAPVARWLGVAVVPLLAALAAGKLAMVLGGAGQGLPYDGQWATAFAGPGPWASLAPMIPSHPAQIYEAVTSAGVLVLVLLLALVPSLRRHPAALFAVGIGGWALGRFAVASLWRDPTLVAGLNGDQVVTAAIATAAVVALVAIAVRARLSRRPASAAT